MRSTVLIVDDNPANLGVLVESLAAAGYHLLVAEDGEDALLQTQATNPDLILLDAMIPGLDGFETCMRLKASSATRDIPVIFMTALGDTTDKVRAFEVGGVDYVTKPFQQEEVLSRIRTHLELKRTRQQLAAQLAVRERFMRIARHDLRNQVCLLLLNCQVGEHALKASAGNPKLPLVEPGHLIALFSEVGRQMCAIRSRDLTFLGRPRGAPPPRVRLAPNRGAAPRRSNRE